MYLVFISSVLISYLLGSLNSSIILIKKVFNVDIRNYGSGNAGATNVYRTFGPKYAAIVFALDAIKGFLAVHLVYFFPCSVDPDYTNEKTALQLMFGIAVVLGHIFPVLFQFKGGKGVATVLGIIIGINFSIALGLLAIFLFVLLTTNYVSLGSIMSAIAYPILVLVFDSHHPLFYVLFSFQIPFVIIYAHRKNISKLVKGNESKFIKRSNRS